jgi:hypothetical protein
MNRNNILIGSLVVASVLAAVGYGAYRLGQQQGMTGTTGPAVAHSTAETPDAVHTVDPSAWTIAQGQEATERHLRWHQGGDIDLPPVARCCNNDPMTPVFDARKSPSWTCLVPQYAGAPPQ